MARQVFASRPHFIPAGRYVRDHGDPDNASADDHGEPRQRDQARAACRPSGRGRPGEAPVRHRHRRARGHATSARGSSSKRPPSSTQSGSAWPTRRPGHGAGGARRRAGQTRTSRSGRRWQPRSAGCSQDARPGAPRRSPAMPAPGEVDGSGGARPVACSTRSPSRWQWSPPCVTRTPTTTSCSCRAYLERRRANECEARFRPSWTAGGHQGWAKSPGLPAVTPRPPSQPAFRVTWRHVARVPVARR